MWIIVRSEQLRAGSICVYNNTTKFIEDSLL